MRRSVLRFAAKMEDKFKKGVSKERRKKMWVYGETYTDIIFAREVDTKRGKRAWGKRGRRAHLWRKGGRTLFIHSQGELGRENHGEVGLRSEGEREKGGLNVKRTSKSCPPV